MEENNNKTQNQAIVVIGLIALIIALFIGVKLIFAGLDRAMPDLKNMAAEYEQSQTVESEGAPGADQSAAAPADGEDAAGPNFCPHCGGEMRDGFQWGQFCPQCGKKVE